MKFLSIVSLLVAGALAGCNSNERCCNNCGEVFYQDNQGDWGVEDNQWCILPDKCNNFPNCNNCNVAFTDAKGNWGIENGNWCLTPSWCNSASGNCPGQNSGYQCCNGCNVVYTDNEGKWGVENGNWCGIKSSCGSSNPTTTIRTTTTTTNNASPTNPGPSDPTNFFTNQLYVNPTYQKSVQASMNKLSGDLKNKAAKVLDVPTAVWLAWDGAISEAATHLQNAGNKTVVFVLYYIPTRDCNSMASQGGAKDFEGYKSYVDSLYNTISAHSSSKVVMIIEPDTIPNMVTSQNNQNCSNVAVLHKKSIAYAVDKLGRLNNVQTYLDVGNSKWLDYDGPREKAAQIVKDIVSQAPVGKIRGLSTNVSNFHPVHEEYGYLQRLNGALNNLGVNNLHYVIDTCRNGVDVSAQYAQHNTWCNIVGTGFGQRPKGNPDLGSMPLLDAYMWIKPGGESDGSGVGSRADPVCRNPDSLQTAPDAGQWFHEYFVQLLTNANPPF